MSSHKSAHTDRSHGGPGSSQQNAAQPVMDKPKSPMAGQPTNRDKSKISGGGGERDSHHTHDAKRKGGHA